MNSSDYKTWAITKDLPSYRTLADKLVEEQAKLRLMHAVLGISGESGELTDAIKKNILYSKALDITNVKEECGDILWYMALLLDQVGSSFEEVMQMNHDKLEKRYPSGFTEKDAIARADKVPTDEQMDFLKNNGGTYNG